MFSIGDAPRPTIRDHYLVSTVVFDPPFKLQLERGEADEDTNEVVTEQAYSSHSAAQRAAYVRIGELVPDGGTVEADRSKVPAFTVYDHEGRAAALVEIAPKHTEQDERFRLLLHDARERHTVVRSILEAIQRRRVVTRTK